VPQTLNTANYVYFLALQVCTRVNPNLNPQPSTLNPQPSTLNPQPLNPIPEAQNYVYFLALQVCTRVESAATVCAPVESAATRAFRRAT